MSRLTNKHFSINPPRSIKKCRQDFYVAVEDKLRRLEDIEEELGIDLITLFKALDLKQPIFVRDFQGACEFNDTIVSSRFITNGNQLALVDDFSRESMYLNLNEYGKAWALTKEELDE